MNNLVGKWVIDPTRSNVTFSVRHLISKVEGRFGEFTGEANVHEDISDSTVYGVVDVSTITTHDEERDVQVRSPEFFDVGNYPSITFKTNRWNTSESTDEITLEGELTIKEVARPVTFTGKFEALDSDGSTNARAALTLTTTIDRTEWGLIWDSPADKGLVLGNDVTIVVEAEAVLADPAPENELVPTPPDEPETSALV